MINITEKEIMKNWKGDILEPVVSICCITYNHEQYISEAINSFFMQETDFPFEIVIGEDCSTDGTRKVIDRYTKEYPNLIKLVTSEINVGMNANFNRTIKTCIGKYIALCEGDDYWIDSKKLQLQADFLKNNDDFNLCFHNFKTLRGSTLSSSNTQLLDVITFEEYASNMPNIQTLSTMFRNSSNCLIPDEFINKVKGSHFLFLKISENSKIKFINEEMAVYRVHDGGIWSKQNTQNQCYMALDNINAMIEYYKNNQSVISRLKKVHDCKAFYYMNYFFSHFNFKFSFMIWKKLYMNKFFFLFRKCFYNYYKELLVRFAK